MRKMNWVKTAQRQSWVCSECAWWFNPVGPAHGDSIDEMKLNYERQRDKEFAAHVCAHYPKTADFGAKGQEPEREGAKGTPKLPRRFDGRPKD